MKKIAPQITVKVATILILLAGFASTSYATGGLIGDCSDCHTMHNSFQNQSVAVKGTSDTPTSTPIQNLLKMDCIACHAVSPTGADKVVILSGGSQIPQVMHADATGDLAGGNFQHIAAGGNRKGHNVVDLVAAETDLTEPPGYRHTGAEVGVGGFDVDRFTCAGSMGCHGFRGQVLSTSDLYCDEFGIKWINGESTDEYCTAEDYENEGTSYTYRTGLSALSGYDGPGVTTELKRGAHHGSYDGFKNDGLLGAAFYDSPLTHSYRFIRSLRGYGNETGWSETDPGDRWQNVSATSHNEYLAGFPDNPLGDQLRNTDFGTTTVCSRCHVGGQNSTTSRLTVPGNGMTGLCLTCHGSFHAPSSTEGAFLRHPADYVIPNSGEFTYYTEYDVTAPVGRPHSVFVDTDMWPSDVVTPGEDLVMCLSCHVAHASENDGMLRYEYDAAGAGSLTDIAAAQALGGCFACHPTKGVLPEFR